MAKAPAFQFYVKDWLSDPQLKMASHSTKGIWADMLCFMWDAPLRGELVGSRAQIQRMVGATDEDMATFFSESKSLCFCYFSVTDNGIVTVRNRRMWREEKDRKNSRERQVKFRLKHKYNDEITPPSPSPSPSPSPNNNIKATPEPFRLPSKEELENQSTPKILDSIELAANDLYKKKIWPQVHAYKNAMLKKGCNERAILKSLTKCVIKRPNNPWAYCSVIMKQEDGNFNALDYEKNHT